MSITGARACNAIKLQAFRTYALYERFDVSFFSTVMTDYNVLVVGCRKYIDKTTFG